MPMLSHMDLNAIRESVTAHQTGAAKLNSYAASCTDPQLQQMFKKAAQDSTQAAQQLIQML